MQERYDLVVIGGGPGGYVAAIRAAQKGMRVALAERDKLGGTCLNRGCIPTKALLHTANVYAEIAAAGALGIEVKGAALSMPRIRQRRDEVVEQLRGGVAQLLKANGVEVLRGSACIPESGRVRVQTGEERHEIAAANILVATGSVPAMPAIEGLEGQGVYTSDDLLEGEMPRFESLIIIGGGVIGVEFATVYAAFGCEVTVLEAAGSLLPMMDREISQTLGMSLKQRGVQVVCGAAVQRLERQGDALACHYEGKTGPAVARADAVLVATGRRANIEGVFSGPAPVMDRGVRVDTNFLTSLPGVYAIGDCVQGSVQLAHAASAQGLCAVGHMAGQACEVDLSLIPACVYTNPEIACVGLSAEEAKAQGFATTTGKYLTAGLGKSVIEEAGRGFIKLVAEQGSGRLLGAQLVCPRATDLVGELATAIANGLTAEQVAHVVHPHPTFCEGTAEAAEDVFGAAIHIAPRRRPSV